MFMSKVPKEVTVEKSQLPGPGAYFDEGSPTSIEAQTRVAKVAPPEDSPKGAKRKEDRSLSPGHYQPDAEKERARKKLVLIYKSFLGSTQAFRPHARAKAVA